MSAVNTVVYSRFMSHVYVVSSQIPTDFKRTKYSPLVDELLADVNVRRVANFATSKIYPIILLCD